MSCAWCCFIFLPHSIALPMCVFSLQGLTWWGTVRLFVLMVATNIYFTYFNPYLWTITWYNLKSGKMDFVFEHKLLMFLSISQHTYSFSHVVFRVSCEENGTSGRCYEVVSTSTFYCPRCLRLSRPVTGAFTAQIKTHNRIVLHMVHQTGPKYGIFSTS